MGVLGVTELAMKSLFEAEGVDWRAPRALRSGLRRSADDVLDEDPATRRGEMRASTDLEASEEDDGAALEDDDVDG